MLRIAENDARRSKKRSKSVAFKDEEEVINPEDVDPTIGKFRNLVQTSVIPNKKVKPDFASTMFGTGSSGSSSSAMLTECDPSPFNDNHTNHYSNHSQSNHSSRSQSFASNMLLGKFQIPNPAPDIDLDRQPQQSIASAPAVPSVGVVASMVNDSFGFDNSIRDEQQRKKKYAKEAWPGRKPPAMSM